MSFVFLFFLRTSKYNEGRRIVIESDHLKLVSMSAVHFQTSYRILCSTALLCTFVLNICHGSISKGQEELGGRVILSRPNSAQKREPQGLNTPQALVSQCCSFHQRGYYLQTVPLSQKVELCKITGKRQRFLRHLQVGQGLIEYNVLEREF